MLRLAQAVEVNECWQIALTQRTEAVSLLCSSQALSAVCEIRVDHNPCSQGAYVMSVSPQELKSDKGDATHSSPNTSGSANACMRAK